MKLEWETIDNYHTRAKVFGGWLVKAYECQEHASYMTDQGYWARTQSHEMSVSMAFVPDPQHRWDIKELTHSPCLKTGDSAIIETSLLS